MDRNTDKLAEKALEASKVIRELGDLARENGFGLELNEYGDLTFNDWHSSDCYGEGNSDTFGVNSDGTIWVTSSC